jgi:hypothetical protein
VLSAGCVLDPAGALTGQATSTSAAVTLIRRPDPR